LRKPSSSSKPAATPDYYRELVTRRTNAVLEATRTRQELFEMSVGLITEYHARARRVAEEAQKQILLIDKEIERVKRELK